MTRNRRIIRAIDVFFAMYACVALLNYAYTKNIRGGHHHSSQLSTAQSYSGNSQSTIDTYELMCANSPYDPTLRRKLGDAYYNLAQNEKAAAAYKEALRLNPSDYETYLRLGTLYISMNRFEDAQAAIEQARRIAPNSFRVREAFSDLDERRLYARFISEQANNPRSAYVAATEYLARHGDRNDEVVQYLRKWVEEFEARVPPANRPLQNPPPPVR